MVPSAAAVTSSTNDHGCKLVGLRTMPSASLTTTCTVSPACHPAPLSTTVAPAPYTDWSVVTVGVVSAEAGDVAEAGDAGEAGEAVKSTANDTNVMQDSTTLRMLRGRLKKSTEIPFRRAYEQQPQ